MAMMRNTRAALLRRREKLMDDLEQVPGAKPLVYRLKEIQYELDHAETPPGDYALFKTQQEAIVSYLERAGTWCDRRQIGRDIMAGGFPIPSKIRGATYIGDTAMRMAEKGKLQQIDRRLIGLNGWAPPIDSGEVTT